MIIKLCQHSEKFSQHLRKWHSSPHFGIFKLNLCPQTFNSARQSYMFSPCNDDDENQHEDYYYLCSAYAFSFD